MRLAAGGATCSGVDRDRSGGGLRRCAGGLLAVGSCPGSEAECASAVVDRVHEEQVHVLAVSETAQRCNAMAVTEDTGWRVHFFVGAAVIVRCWRRVWLLFAET